MKRKIYNELIKWKNDSDKLPLMVLGVRQCGKTYVIDEFCENEYRNYCKINLFEDSYVVSLFDMELDSEEKYNRLKTYLKYDIEDRNTILFIDEIQESESLISQLKFLCEKHPNVNIICAGSLLGVKLKRFKKSFPVGKVKMINMYPMDFEEFLIAYHKESMIDLLKDCYKNNKALMEPLHSEMLKFYQTYLITGGMPAAVKNMVKNENDYSSYDRSIIENIVSSYYKDMKKYVNSDSEALKIEKTYKSLPSQLMNASKKFQFSNVDNGARSREYETAIDWLLASNLVLKCDCTKVPNSTLGAFVDENTFKLFLSDVGILTNMAYLSTFEIINDDLGLYKGVIAENFVANQLVANGFLLYYWRSDATAEVDFLIKNKDGVIPIEVKGGDNTKSKSLKVYVDKYNPKYAIRISTKDFGFNPDTKIKSVPIYATFLIENDLF